jgi:hypothetical protein
MKEGPGQTHGEHYDQGIYDDIKFLRNKSFFVVKEKMRAAVEDITGCFSLIYEEEEIIISYCDMMPESQKHNRDICCYTTNA